MGLLKKMKRAGRKEAEFTKMWIRHLSAQKDLKNKIDLANIAELTSEDTETEKEA